MLEEILKACETEIAKECTLRVQAGSLLKNPVLEVGQPPEGYAVNSLGRGINKVYIYDDAGIAPAEDFETMALRAWGFSVGVEVVEQQAGEALASIVVTGLKKGQRLGGLAVSLQIVNVTQPVRIDPQRPAQVTKIDALVIFRGDPE